LFSEYDTTLLLRGGTNVSKSPSIEYIEYILLPFLKTHFNVKVQLDVRSRGFSSQGGGEVFLRIERLKKPLPCVEVLDRGEVVEFTGVIWSSGQESQKVSPHPFPCNQNPLKK